MKQELPLKHIEALEVSDKHTKSKIAVVLAAIFVALVAFGFGIGFGLSESMGWKVILLDTEQENCSGDFVYYYHLEKNGWSGKKQLDAVKNTYTEACINAYRIFNSDKEFAGMHNIATLNKNPNKEITPDPALYSALELIQQTNSKAIFLGPVYEFYYNVFFAFDETYAAENDPHKNAQVAEIVRQIVEFVSDDSHINLELTNGKAKLSVSESYATFVNEQGGRYLDLFVMKNAFIADYIAQFMSQKGFGGIISSFDGYMRSFLNSDGCSVNVFDLDGNTVNLAAVLNVKDELSAVRFRDYDSTRLQYDYFYTYSDGNTVTPYLADGLNRSCTHDLLTYSYTRGCAETALRSLPVYTTEQLHSDGIATLKAHSVFSVYCKDKVVFYNDPTAEQYLDMSADNIYAKRFVD